MAVVVPAPMVTVPERGGKVTATGGGTGDGVVEHGINATDGGLGQREDTIDRSRFIPAGRASDRDRGTIVVGDGQRVAVVGGVDGDLWVATGNGVEGDGHIFGGLNQRVIDGGHINRGRCCSGTDGDGAGEGGKVAATGGGTGDGVVEHGINATDGGLGQREDTIDRSRFIPAGRASDRDRGTIVVGDGQRVAVVGGVDGDLWVATGNGVEGDGHIFGGLNQRVIDGGHINRGRCCSGTDGDGAGERGKVTATGGGTGDGVVEHGINATDGGLGQREDTIDRSRFIPAGRASDRDRGTIVVGDGQRVAVVGGVDGDLWVATGNGVEGDGHVFGGLDQRVIDGGHINRGRCCSGTDGDGAGEGGKVTATGGGTGDGVAEYGINATDGGLGQREDTIDRSRFIPAGRASDRDRGTIVVGDGQRVAVVGGVDGDLWVATGNGVEGDGHIFGGLNQRVIDGGHINRGRCCSGTDGDGAGEGGKVAATGGGTGDGVAEYGINATDGGLGQREDTIDRSRFIPAGGSHDRDRGTIVVGDG